MTSTTKIITLGRKRRPSRGSLLLLIPGVATVVLLGILPLFIVARNSFAEADNYGGIIGGFTLEHYIKLLDRI